jgi:hypothetical protein
MPSNLTSGTSHLLCIDLQDGFHEDIVRIRVNNQLLVEKEKVTSSPLTGIATYLETTVTGTLKLEVAVVNRGLTTQRTMQITTDTYIGVSIMAGRLDIIIRYEPFGYG